MSSATPTGDADVSGALPVTACVITWLMMSGEVPSGKLIVTPFGPLTVIVTGCPRSECRIG
jgi:hypothetical protein